MSASFVTNRYKVSRVGGEWGVKKPFFRYLLIE